MNTFTIAEQGKNNCWHHLGKETQMVWPSYQKTSNFSFFIKPMKTISMKLIHFLLEAGKDHPKDGLI